MFQKLILSLLLPVFLAGIVQCNDSDDDQTGLLLAVAALSLCSSGVAVNKTETLFSGGPSCQTTIASDAPSWIQQNFHCMTVKVCGSNYVITTTNLPPYKSAYYGASSPFFETFNTAGGRNINPNKISSQNITLTIPITPTLVTSNLDSTQGIDSIGVSTYGIVLFNNEAAPGDSLATEYLTMDGGDGHPQNTGKYHHHTEPLKLTSDGSELIGLMLDGYPLYGKRDQAGAVPTLDATTNSRQCTTTHFPNGTYCYHVVNGTGVNAYLLGSSFRGRRGSSN
jgi:YHYH protein